MSVPYVSAGQSIRHTQLNALTAETDAVLKCLLGGKSPLIYYGGDGLLPMGHIVAFGAAANWKIIPLIASLSALAEYDHTTFTTAAAALTVASYDATNEVANVDIDDPWPLDGSLEAHTKTYLGDAYFFRQRTNTGTVQGYRERYLKLDTLDVIMEGMSADLTWDSAWNKYHFIRFHNLDRSSRTVAMPGSVNVVIPALGCQAVRRSYPNENTYDTTYQYLWKAESGDLLFYDAIRANNVASLKCFFDILDNAVAYIDHIAGTTRSTIFLKASEVWDGSRLLPSTLEASAKAYQLRYHLGRIISWEDAAGTPDPHDFTPTWATLAAGTNGVKWDESTLTLSANTGAVTPVDAIGVGSNLLPMQPDTLPYDASFALSRIRAIGVGQSTETLSAQYWNGSAFVTVSEDYTLNEATNASEGITGDYASPVSADAADALSTIGTLASSNGTEALSVPTVSWKSDGWRVVGYGTQSLAYTLGTLPGETELPYCVLGASSLTQHFGADILNRGYFDGMSRQHGRELSDYVGFTDVHGTVYYEGHPDLTGNYQLAGGIDYVEDRQTNDESEVLRDDPLTQAIETTTRGVNVYVMQDSVENVVANAADGSWYASNRTRLLAGTPTTAEKQRLVRYPMLARHYNAVAQYLNSIMSIRPLTLDDVLYYGLAYGTGGIADGTWTAAAYPPNYYCAVLSTGSKASALGITITGSGSEKHLTLSTAAAWAATLGVRFCKRRMASHRRLSGGVPIRTRLTNALYRLYPSNPVWVGRCVEDNSASTPPNYLANPSVTNYEELISVEYGYESGAALPTGWTWANDAKLMTVPRPSVNWTNDPTEDAPGNSVLQVWPAAEVDAEAWDATDFDNTTLDSPTISALYELSPIPDARTTWQVQLANRFYIVRT